MATIRIPKRVAGVKIPKELRRTANRALDQANSPQGREMIAAALSMAAAAASAAVVKARAEREAATPPAPPPPTPPTSPEPPLTPVPTTPPVPPRPPEGAQARPDPQQVADAVGQVAEQVLGRLFGGKRPG